MSKKDTLNKREKEIAKAEVAVPKRKDSIYLLCGLIALSLAVYTFVALTSFLFNWMEDQSVFSTKDFFASSVDVENDGGKIGLIWANFLISKLFGMGAFIIPFFFAGVAIFCLRIKKIRIIRFFFLSIFGCIILSITCSFIFSFTNVETWFGTGAGGSYGHYVNLWMKKMLGATGTGAILCLAIITWLICMNSKIVLKFNNWIDKITAPKPKKVKEEVLDMQDIKDQETLEDTVSTINDSYNIKDKENVDIVNDIKEDDNTDVIDPDSNPVLEILSSPDLPSSSDSTDELDLESLRPDENSNIEPENISEKESDDNFLDQYTEGQLNTMFDPRLDLANYQAPPINLLEDYKDKWYEVSRDELEKNNRQIVKTLSNYKIGVSKISARIGPTVTLYEIVPAPGVRVSQIKRLEEDIQLSLAAKGVRVVTLIGTNAIGIEVANERPSTVSMLSVIDDAKFKEANYDLPVALGKTITNEVLHFDLAKMPHLLVAGATGQGKSVGLNAILASLLYRKHPSELKLVLVDPKKVELSLYSKLEKHFLAKLPDADEPVITDTQKVIYTLKSLCIEMDSRYDLLKLASVRNVKEYNEKFLQRRLNPLKGHKFMPYIVVVIDEFADLLMTAGREIEEPIARLAQLARAIGIHLVIATQRPTTSVITGNIKANFPARIAFMVRSSIDSRTILDQTGANQLIGRGDMLISTGGDLTRVQCAFIDTKEVERIVDFISAQRGYSTAAYLPEYTGEEKEDGGAGVGEVDLNRRDALFEDAANLVVMHQQGSTSLIQRKMNLRYNRSARIMDQLEVAGIVGPFEGSKARQVLVGDLSELDLRLSSIRDIYG